MIFPQNFRPLLIGLFSIALGVAVGQEVQPSSASIQVPLVVHTGVPLRVYVTKRLRMRENEPVNARLIDPIYAFDRVVVPSGAELQGHVTGFDPVSKMKRAQAILGGDFTPLHFARVEFTTIVMPDGQTRAIQTLDSEGLPTIYSPPRPSKKKGSNPQNNSGVLGTAKQQIKDQLHQQISAKSRGVIDLVRGPNKKEWLEDYLIKKLPYHPQWYRRNTRFDAILRQSIGFGTATVSDGAIGGIGLPSGDSVAQVRLTTPLSSADADTNTKVEGILSQPIFSADHHLVLPEGTLLTGRVRKAQAARWFHRGGQLRFTFDRIEPPAWTSISPLPLQRMEAQLSSAEADPRATVKVDAEGNAKATEPKSRFLGPALALIVATQSMEGGDRERGAGQSADGNFGGRSAGGFSGFGMLGSAAAQASKPLGTVLGFYGLGWSVYSTIISRGHEVEFETNTAIQVRFGAQAPDPAKKMGNHLVSTVTR